MMMIGMVLLLVGAAAKTIREIGQETAVV